jgi:Sulfotransferase family
VTPTPLFLLAPSRSGSTLLQRLLAGHSAIATASEPQILLPPLRALEERGAYAVWNQWTLARALEDFAGELPGGRQDYLDAVAAFARDLYGRAAPTATYFLDKTPRYHLIVESLYEAFPDAKFVFLWRNPLAIASSYIDSWGGGRWNLHLFANELHEGIASLADAYARIRKVAVAVRFEDLVVDPELESERILSYLELPLEPGLTERFAQVQLRGRAGDKSGVERYSTISPEPRDTWRTTMANPVRRRWAARHLRWLGDDRLRLMGYERQELLAGLQPARVGGATSDAVRSLRGELSARRRSRLWGIDARTWR